ncbi:MAG: hypothetical protein CL624_09575 [Arcobacter sp.]|jgi:transcriptional regulator with XRE-family HTH domain|nr:hypothetical protein [Arcobacter sp.]|tara:strand:+ start:10703 stop:11125 length:423 start_codon:yes stop_codon:yes gene_type:complete
MYEIKTTSEILAFFAKKIKNERLRQKIKQDEFALKAGISLSTYKTFENKGKGSFENFIKIMIALGKVGELEKLLIEPEFSPKKKVIGGNNIKNIQRVRISSSNKYNKSNNENNNIIVSNPPFSKLLSKIENKKNKEEDNG